MSKRQAVTLHRHSLSDQENKELGSCPPEFEKENKEEEEAGKNISIHWYIKWGNHDIAHGQAGAQRRRRSHSTLLSQFSLSSAMELSSSWYCVLAPPICDLGRRPRSWNQPPRLDARYAICQRWHSNHFELEIIDVTAPWVPDETDDLEKGRVQRLVGIYGKLLLFEQLGKCMKLPVSRSWRRACLVAGRSLMWLTNHCGGSMTPTIKSCDIQEFQSSSPFPHGWMANVMWEKFHLPLRPELMTTTRSANHHLQQIDTSLVDKSWDVNPASSTYVHSPSGVSPFSYLKSRWDQEQGSFLYFQPNFIVNQWDKSMLSIFLALDEVLNSGHRWNFTEIQGIPAILRIQQVSHPCER